MTNVKYALITIMTLVGLFSFFFQAEDGIRDGHVTGVQTCALPIFYLDSARHHVDAQAKEVFDVSGAGDTVLATLAVAKGAGLDWVEAMYWANRAGGMVVGKLGTSVVTAQELR